MPLWLSILAVLTLPGLTAAVALWTYRRDFGRTRLFYLFGVVASLQIAQYILAVAYPLTFGEVRVPHSILLFPLNLLLILLIYAKKGFYELRRLLLRSILYVNVCVMVVVGALTFLGLGWEGIAGNELSHPKTKPGKRLLYLGATCHEILHKRVAEGAGFEPADVSPRRRFSRPMQSAALPPLRIYLCYSTLWSKS